MAQAKETAKKFDPEAAQAAVKATAHAEVNTAEVKETATAVKKASVKRKVAPKAAEAAKTEKTAAAKKAPAKKAETVKKAPAKKAE